MKKIPDLGKEYNVFDDGKIKQSRLYKVKVIEVIPFHNIDKDILDLWEEEVKDCDWLYSESTDVFIKTWNGSDYEYFVRTKLDGGWFSLGFMNFGRLDIDGDLTDSLKHYT